MVEARRQGLQPADFALREAGRVAGGGRGGALPGGPDGTGVTTRQLAVFLHSFAQGICGSPAEARPLGETVDAIVARASKDGRSISADLLARLLAEVQQARGLASCSDAAAVGFSIFHRALSGDTLDASPKGPPGAASAGAAPGEQRVTFGAPECWGVDGVVVASASSSSDLLAGDEVMAYYYHMGNRRSPSTAAARVERVLTEQVEVIFKNGARQVVPKDWVQGLQVLASRPALPPPPPPPTTSLERERSAGRSAGLENLGNTCYMNALLQCLAGTADLVDYFLEGDGELFERDLNAENFLGSGGVVAREFAELLKSLGSGEHRVVAPRKFKLALAAAAEQFSGSDQHDSQEFAAYLLDCLHEDLNRVRGRKPVVEFPDITPKVMQEKGEERIAAECWNLYLQRDKSIIVDLFQGQLRSQITCCKCGFCSTKFDSFMYLSLPVVDHDGVPLSTLETCLQQFSKEERLTGDERWYCPECKEHVDAVKQLSLWKAPPVILVHLMRFRVEMGASRSAAAQEPPGAEAASSSSWVGQALYNGLWCGGVTAASDAQGPVSKKLSHRVSFELEGLDLAASGALPAASAQKVPPVYDLFGLVDHFGSCGFGHYTASVRRADGEWRRYNDDVVSALQPDEVVSEKAYLLFFRRQDAYFRTQTQSFPDAWPHRIEREWSFLDQASLPL